ncbi:MAG: DUF3592 domain-containing protein [Hyphomicrobiaceae bacterium]|nr:DUF3592 domain-containing protein [Hyphomicrobiaceae bacterium]
MRYNPGTLNLVKAIVIGFGALATLAGAALFLTSSLAVSRADRTTGIVVAFTGTTPPAVAKGPPPQPSVAPVIVFTGPDGSEHRFTASWYSTEPAYALGDRVPVLYTRSDPARAWIDSFAENWLPSVIISLVGGTLVLIGFFLPHSRSRTNA